MAAHLPLFVMLAANVVAAIAFLAEGRRQHEASLRAVSGWFGIAGVLAAVALWRDAPTAGTISYVVAFVAAFVGFVVSARLKKRRFKKPDRPR